MCVCVCVCVFSCVCVCVCFRVCVCVCVCVCVLGVRAITGSSIRLCQRLRPRIAIFSQSLLCIPSNASRCLSPMHTLSRLHSPLAPALKPQRCGPAKPTIPNFKYVICAGHSSIVPSSYTRENPPISIPRTPQRNKTHFTNEEWRVLTLLCMCPHTTIYVCSYDYKPPISILISAEKYNYGI